jgi:hypothetical protein
MVALQASANVRTSAREDLAFELQTIERRLEEGYRVIDQAIADGRTIGRWEDHWLDLLREYERIYDELAA